MHLLFEEDGAFKAGTVLSGTDASFQVELPTGKRAKVKSSHVMLRFEQPAPAQLLKDAQQAAEQIDLDFLWECAPQDEFGFEDLAREYHGAAASPVQAASILLRLHGAPVYFHRKGRGRFRPAPAEILKQALAAVDRKRKQDELRHQLVDELKAGRLPPQIAAQGVHLIAKPDKQSLEYKAVEQAASELHLNMLALLLARGAIASPYRWHLDQFLVTTFPRGTGFAADLPPPQVPTDLPLAEVAAFSIDDSATTEIDDAFSVQPLGAAGAGGADGAGGWRIGIHIAAPAVAITRDHALDVVAKARMSTVYAPGLKFTMLPDAWVEAFSLNEGRVVPVVSLYVDIDKDFTLSASQTRVEQVRIVANLRHDRLDDVVTPAAMEAGVVDAPFSSELVLLWRFARTLLARREAVRGRPEPLGRIDYGFELDFAGDAPDENAVVRIKPRKRGAPLDLIVAELMILANSHWGGWLKQHKVPGIYRSQRRVMGVSRVKMSTTPGPHEGMGVDHYAWSSSPLRRFVDLVNQRQIVATARGTAAPYAANDAELFAIVSGFDSAYTSYAEFQERLERYWCLRWLRQENVKRIAATVVKGDLLRFDGLPLLTRVPGLPELPRGQRLELDLIALDEVNLAIEARLHQLLAQQAADETLEDEEEDAVVDAAVEPAAAEEASASGDAAGVDPAPPSANPAEGTIPQAS
jgi:exoribonuclease-2